MAGAMAAYLADPGATRRWRALRERMFRSVRFRCAKCDCGLYLEIHHFVRLEDGGDMWAERNLQVLCRACHRLEHGQPAVSQDVVDWDNFYGI